MEKENPIEEARRYVANAKEIIKNANYDPETKSYEDRKYIKAAGDILWKGCLIALDAVLPIRNGKGRRDRKLLQFINIGYDTMHLVMGYDGNRNKNVCDTGFENANAIIDRCATLYPGTPCA